MNILEGIGSRIQSIRTRLGITQDELGERVGLNPKYISAIECGQRNITIKTLDKIAKGLGVELFELLLFEEYLEPAMSTRKAIDSLLKQADIKVLRLCLQFLKIALTA